MERQCRLCFETDETTPFLTPCNCRGTQAYIHTHCLVLYCRHFPDGICRVCLVQMKTGHSDDSLYCLGMFAWMLALAYGATLPSDPRGMYLTLVAGIILYYLIIRQLPIRYVVLGMLLTSSFLYASIQTIFWILTVCTGLFAIMLLWMYIPTPFLCTGLVIIASALYSSLLVLAVMARTDPVLASMFVCALGALWYLAIRARPPLRIL